MPIYLSASCQDPTGLHCSRDQLRFGHHSFVYVLLQWVAVKHRVFYFENELILCVVCVSDFCPARSTLCWSVWLVTSPWSRGQRNFGTKLYFAQFSSQFILQLVTILTIANYYVYVKVKSSNIAPGELRSFVQNWTKYYELKAGWLFTNGSESEPNFSDNINGMIWILIVLK